MSGSGNRKKPRGRELTATQKRRNQSLARIRVQVEHSLCGVKRGRSTKDVLRNTREGVSDLFILNVCGLQNLRVDYRPGPLRH